MLFSDKDTIVAPATPPGEGGVGILRLSGPNAEALLLRCFRPSATLNSLESHRLYHGYLLDSTRGVEVDEVMAVLMRRPRSYTREDVAEVHCHGGPVVVRRILDLFVACGARLARPGEFTLRAFLNGRLDLTRAEAVIDLIQARSEAAGQVALRQLGGNLSRAIFRLRDELVGLLAPIEASIDFPEEDLPPSDLRHFREKGREIHSEMDRLIATFQAGRSLREGISILLLGRPNVGKSSLLNALLGESRAIVTDIPGTTRDTLEESLVLGSLPLRLIDTAGVRQAVDPVEVEGVRRAREKVGAADLVLLVVDGSQPPTDDDLLALEACRGKKVLVVRNKSDLPPASPSPEYSIFPSVGFSSRTGEGMDNLREAILKPFLGEHGEGLLEEAVLSDRRHREALVRGREGMERFQCTLESGGSPEFLALEVRDALDALGEITGETTPDDILDQIFSKFCIGK